MDARPAVLLHRIAVPVAPSFRKAKTEGPQHITVHGREEVVVSVEEYRRVKGQRAGQALVELLQDSPLRDVTIEHEPTYAPVRGVEL